MELKSAFIQGRTTKKRVSDCLICCNRISQVTTERPGIVKYHKMREAQYNEYCFKWYNSQQRFWLRVCTFQ